MMPKLEKVRLLARRLSIVLPAAAVLLAASNLWAGPCGAACDTGACGAIDCGPTYMEKTIYVPKWITQTKTVMQTQYRPEQRERVVTVQRLVPETRAVERRYTVMVPEVRTKLHTYTVNVPVWREVQKPYHVRVPVRETVQKQFTVMVPYQETLTASRTVCKMVPQTITHTVCRDRGHWADVPYQTACSAYGCGRSCYSGCGSCEPCGRCGGTGMITCSRRVWVPNMVYEQVPRVVYRPQYSQVPYQYTVTRFRPETRVKEVPVVRYVTETRARTVRVCEYQPQQRTREVQFTVCVPQERSKMINLTSYRTVAEQRTVPYTVMTPYQVEKQIPIRVCQMVPKTITVPVSAYCGGGCSTGHHCRWCR